VEGATQTIAQGPVASQVAIKQLGTNGGGFFNANSAHPFESPTPFTNLLHMLLIFVLGAGLTYTFGHMVKDTRQGWALFWAMAVMFLIGVFVAYPAEQAGNPIVANLGIESAATATQSGGNMEGKETRLGIAASALFATVTTDASCGAINSWHDSYTPIGGLVPLFNMQTDEVIFGGVGAGLYGMLFYAILGVFIAGLMVGRTPEYIGKKIQKKEVTMALFAVLATAFFILVFAGATVVLPFDKGSYWNPAGPAIANLGNAGPHGLSEVLYAFTSQTENNGSAFGGITVNTPWYDLTGGLAMLFGRFLFIVPALAIAGSLARKKAVPTSAGTLPTHGPLFVGVLVSTVIVIGALTFFPALSLGPIVEHFLMHNGKLFSTLLVSQPLWS
jgi:potassium-transporting ATPase potassium-binding subunit